MRHALVTGGAGFIGSHLVESLLSDGWKVTVVDSFDPYYPRAAKEKNLAACLNDPRLALSPLDIRDLDSLRCSLSGDYDVIIHLAARAGVRASIVDPIGNQQVNVTGTQNMLELARERGVKQFVFASSSSVYGVNPRVPWCEDDHVLMPISPYAATKVAAELLGHVYSHLYGIRFLALRFFTVYGPRQRPDLAIHKFARLMLEDKPITVYGDGSTRRDYTYVSDVVQGIRSAIAYRASMYEVINLGNNCTVSLLRLIEELSAALDAIPRLEFLPEQPGDVPQTWADIRKAQQLLGYSPRTRLEEGLARFGEWLRNATGGGSEGQGPGLVPAGSPGTYR